MTWCAQWSLTQVVTFSAGCSHIKVSVFWTLCKRVIDGQQCCYIPRFDRRINTFFFIVHEIFGLVQELLACSMEFLTTSRAMEQCCGVRAGREEEDCK